MLIKALPVLILFSACSSLNDAQRWAAIEFPKNGATKSYGTHNAGCIQGAKKIATEGRGHVLKNPNKKTNYAHPDMLAYIKKLAGKRKFKLKIGDLSQPRGGPFLTGHTSHQTGLDVDIDYPVGNFPYTQILYRAVRDQKVERVFVNYKIKQELCKKFKGRSWLNKIRPWRGHNKHFHVRLKCPANSKTCLNPKAPVPAGDGCDKTLAWWFGEEVKKETFKRKQKDLPKNCQKILSEEPLL